MKRTHLILPALLLILGFLGCSGDSPTTLTGPANDIADKDNPWVYGSFYQDIVQPCECLGEDVRFLGEVPFRYKEVSNDGERYVYRWQAILQGPDQPPFVAIGQTTGTVYEYKVWGPVFEMILSGPNDVHIFRDKELYIAEDGSRIYVHWDITFVTNGNGDLVVSRDMPWLVECLD